MHTIPSHPIPPHAFSGQPHMPAPTFSGQPHVPAPACGGVGYCGALISISSYWTHDIAYLFCIYIHIYVYRIYVLYIIVYIYIYIHISVPPAKGPAGEDGRAHRGGTAGGRRLPLQWTLGGYQSVRIDDFILVFSKSENLDKLIAKPFFLGFLPISFSFQFSNLIVDNI